LVENVLSKATEAEQSSFKAWETEHAQLEAERRIFIKQKDNLNISNDLKINNLNDEINTNKARAQNWIKEKTGDGGETNLIFLHYVLNSFPSGMLGLLIAVLLAASMSSTSAELSALTSSTAWDWKGLFSKSAQVQETNSSPTRLRWITFFWGLYAIGFALLAYRLGSLIEAVNAVGSLVYGAVLGVFVVGWFLPKIQSNAVFTSVLLVEATVLILWTTQDWPFLWYNPLGCLGVVALSWLLQQAAPFRSGRKAMPH
jgi:Na+/proline symporter